MMNFVDNLQKIEGTIVHTPAIYVPCLEIMDIKFFPYLQHLSEKNM